MATLIEKRIIREAQFLSDWAATNGTKPEYDALQELYVEDMNELDLEQARLENLSDPPGHPIRPK